MRGSLRIAALGMTVAAVVVGAAAVSGPDNDLTEHRRSDAFWLAVKVNGAPAESYTSLRDMTLASDAVVVGHFTRVALGREVRDLDAEVMGIPREEASVFFAEATIAVDDDLSGQGDTAIRLQILLPNQNVLPIIEEAMPTERALFFLRDMGAKAKRGNFPPQLTEGLQGVFDVVSEQGLLREFRGRVEPPLDSAVPFVLELRGADFEETAKQVEAWLP